MKIHNYTSGTSYFKKLRRRYDVEGHARELTFSCYRGYRFFSRERTCQWFIDALVSARATYPFDLWAYVIMPEHIHLLVYPREAGMKIGLIVGEIKADVGSKAVKYIRRRAPEWLRRITICEGKRIRRRFWQPGGGFDRNGVEIETIHHMINYIHANPVCRNLVQHPEDWYWSSARWYAGLRPVPIEIDATIPMLQYRSIDVV